ncbi:cyclic nucleotide-binding protein [Nitzschia inconspicua]|uniref:Cyclic nucleotide-binding protein n=1 Tax=Nitzschia inconspicua TaxID=303405 RepID=A0A9K3LXN6_9STRA|nr:cyclic nucleotide-binding protein [Nitzschia inconspicua]
MSSPPSRQSTIIIEPRSTKFVPPVASPLPLSQEDQEKCRALLKDCEMFHKMSAGQLKTLASRMKLMQLHKNQILIQQGTPTKSFYLLDNGEIRREFLDPGTGKRHTVEFLIKAKSINSMRVLSGDPIHSTVRCVSKDGCRMFEMHRETLLQTMRQHPDMGIQMASALSEEVRVASKKYATPLLEQRQQEINVPAVMIAAGIESYYRSALNAQINRVLTGVSSEMFPNMHIQVPVRISYITGFKGLRSLMDRTMDSQENSENSNENQFALRLFMAISPGVIMTPISSILEASNAGHLNNEPMATRWLRGIVARCGREIVFGLGLNQLSDYWEERWQEILGRNKTSPVISNAAGSLTAGVISGYFSHVPHNLSTYKLLEPKRSYADLYAMFVDRSVPNIVDSALKSTPMFAESPTLAQFVRYMTATIFPRGLIVRTTQIVGSFMILNGTINYLQLREHKKFQKLINVPPLPEDDINKDQNVSVYSGNRKDDAIESTSSNSQIAATSSVVIPADDR